MSEFDLTNPLREALKELTYDSLPPLPKETLPTTLQRPSEACWKDATDLSGKYFRGDTATEYNVALAELRQGWDREEGETSEKEDLREMTEKLHDITYKWPDKLGLTLAKVLDNFASDNYQPLKEAALHAVTLARGKSGTDYMGLYKNYVDHIMSKFDQGPEYERLDALRGEHFRLEESEKSARTQSADEESLK